MTVDLDFVADAMAAVREGAMKYRVPLTNAEYAAIREMLEYHCVNAIERDYGSELAWIGEGQAEARRLTYGY